MSSMTMEKPALCPAPGAAANACGPLGWTGPEDSLVYGEEGIRAVLMALDETAYVVSTPQGMAITTAGQLKGFPGDYPVAAVLPPLPPTALGSPEFRQAYGLKYAYYAGAMANAIASEALVIELGRAGFLGSFGAAGMPPARLEAAIRNIQSALPDGPYAFNLIHAPYEEALERRAVELYLRYNVHHVEASAFLDLTPSVVYYRAAGLSAGADGEVVIGNRIVAKLSRREVAEKFMRPAPEKMLAQLVQEGKITSQQAELAKRVPMADDITVEADSGGHTDNRPLVCLMPGILSLRDEIQAQYNYAVPVRVGAAGGISTPSSVQGAFAMGADFVVTGTVNQACVEAGASEHTRKLLANAGMADVIMAPSADMFEMGVKVQVLKTGTMFAMRAQKLYETYVKYDSIETIPTDEREKLEKTIFKRSLDEVWADTVKFFQERDPEQIERANASPKRKMALVFRWYLGLSSRWSNGGEQGRELDYQIWCGPSIGPFNDWTRGTYLEPYTSRKAADVALHLMTGCAYLTRVQMLKNYGVSVTTTLATYRPEKQLI